MDSAECALPDATLSADIKEAVDELTLALDRLDSIVHRIRQESKRIAIASRRPTPVPPPLPKFIGGDLRRGERIILNALEQEGGECDMATLQRRTGYAPGTLRTFIPMLRARGLIHPNKLTLSEKLGASPQPENQANEQ